MIAMIFFMLLRTCLLVTPVFANSQLGRPLTAAAVAVGAAQFAPLEDDAIDRAVESLNTGLAAARALAPECEADLSSEASYVALHQTFMTEYVRQLAAYRDEFLVQRDLVPAARSTDRLRARAFAIGELMRRAHRELRALARETAPRAELP